MRGHRTQQDLCQEQGDHDPEILRRGPHRQRDRGHRQRVGRRQHRHALFARVIDRVMPTEQADAGDQEQHAEYRPQERAGRRPVAYQVFGRPVVGVGDVLARMLRRRGPGGPPVERGQRAAVLRIGHRVVLHGIGFTKNRGIRLVGEQAVVVRRHLCDGLGAVRIERDRAACRIETVLAD
jgi:hypothetical protein